jgi:hypothetical protein
MKKTQKTTKGFEKQGESQHNSRITNDLINGKEIYD